MRGRLAAYAEVRCVLEARIRLIGVCVLAHSFFEKSSVPRFGLGRQGACIMSMCRAGCLAYGEGSVPYFVQNFFLHQFNGRNYDERLSRYAVI